jgi:hypothetical protein
MESNLCLKDRCIAVVDMFLRGAVVGFVVYSIAKTYLL